VAVDEPGFDIVIGNPPYVQIQKLEQKLKEEYEACGFKTFSKSADVYCLFYEVGIQSLLKPDGILCYITSNSWLRTKYGGALRKFFTELTNPLKLVNLEDTQMFPTAIVETNILLAQKAVWDGKLNAVTLPSDYDPEVSLSTFLRTYWQTLTELSEDGWTIGTEEDAGLKGKMDGSGKELSDWNVKINYGVKTGLNPAFIHAESVIRELLRIKRNEKVIQPIITGEDISRYSYEVGNQYIINSHNGVIVDKKTFDLKSWDAKGKRWFDLNGVTIEVDRIENISPKRVRLNRVILDEDYPEIFQFLNGFSDSLIKRSDQGIHWSNLRSCSYLYEMQKPKVFWGELSDKPKFAYDDCGFLMLNTGFFIVGERLKYLLSFLNSTAGTWYFKQISTSSGMGTTRWLHHTVKKLPIPVPTLEQELQVETLVNYVLYLRNPKNKQLIDHTTNERIAITIEEVIDMVVFELYFPEHMKDKKIDVLQFLEPKAISEKGTEEDRQTILDFYKWLQTPKNEIRQRIIVANNRSPEVVFRIKSSLK
jgi:hypothetical protein